MVGHVDEFLTFVPAKGTNKGFKLLLASPNVCYRLLQELEAQGAGTRRCSRQEASRPLQQRVDATTTVSQVLGNQKLAAENSRYQAHLDWNRDVLMRELGLADDDIGNYRRCSKST